MYPELELTKDHLPGVPETLAMATHYSGLWRRMHIPCAYARQRLSELFCRKRAKVYLTAGAHLFIGGHIFGNPTVR